VHWSAVFKTSFMVLFVAYPGIALKIMRTFKCRYIDGTPYLAVDMRLRCYDSTWFGYATYAFIMGVVYMAGLPLSVLWILWRRRHKLFATERDSKGQHMLVAVTVEKYGFLYEDYGPSAWWWEVEELVRKLLLSAVIVLIDEGSPLQVTLAVLISGWAHVLHAVYKPWGAGSVLYRLQHGALFVTSFVFLMGLLFKVDGVSTRSDTYGGLSGIMVALCASFIAAWVAVIVARVVSLWAATRRSGVSGHGLPPGVGAPEKSPAPALWSSAGGAWVGRSTGASRGAAATLGVHDAGHGSIVDDVAMTTDSRVVAATTPFVVENPLRRPNREVEGRGVAVHPGTQADGDESHSSASAVHVQSSSPSAAVQRLERVLAVQRPIQLTRLDNPSKQDGDL
jgi:hypothetical protein